MTPDPCRNWIEPFFFSGAVTLARGALNSALVEFVDDGERAGVERSGGVKYMNDPRSNEWTHPEGSEHMSVPESTEPLVDRVRFDIIGKTESGHQLRVWTDGDRVVWEDDEGRSGYMPAMLFRLAAHAVADYCEDKAIEAGEDGDTFFDMVHDSLWTPVTLAMAHPYWADPDDARNELRFGFSSIATNMAMDVQPDGLKPHGATRANRDAIADDRCKQCGKGCPNATCPACQEENVRRLNSGTGSESGLSTDQRGDGPFLSGGGYGGERL